MKASFFVIVLFSCFISAFGYDLDWQMKCEMYKVFNKELSKEKMDSSCVEYFHKQDSIQVIKDSLFQYLSKHSAMDKKTKRLKFKGVNVQEFSRKNEQYGSVFFSVVAKRFFNSSHSLIPRGRKEKNGYWIVPCLVSWSEDGAINDGETAFCLSKDSVWPCFTEWQKEKKEND